MKNQEKIFIAGLVMCLGLLLATVADNTLSLFPKKNPSVQKEPQATIAGTEAKAKFKNAGLFPQEAKYWKILSP